MAVMRYENLFEACRELFGQEIDASGDFLRYLQHSGIKSAFRIKAKETHPDKFNSHPPQAQAVQAEQFCRVRTAYELLCRFVSQREEGLVKRNATAGPRHGTKRDSSSNYHAGAMPQHALPIGRYLYYCKAITFRELLLALAWQRSARRPVGAIAREWGWLTLSDVATVMLADMPGKFGEKAVRLGLIDEGRLRIILMEQKLRHRRLGQYFVEHQLLTPKELNDLRQGLRLHNARFSSFS